MKTSFCDTRNCRQARACPCDVEFSLVNIIAMLCCAFLIGAPFACWLLGVGC